MSKQTKTKNLVLGVTGGIAAYKTPELVRHLKKDGWDVRVVLTQSAKAFVTPLTLQVVSGHKVQDSLWEKDSESVMSHIELANWADCLLIAPASAHCLCALSHGQADNLLTTIALATKAPLVLAPAMNQNMWAHPAVKANVATLNQRGAVILGPEFGAQACGEVGLGRMLATREVAVRLKEQAHIQKKHSGRRPGKLAGKNVMITAGPTREPIDAVRYISNLSSGKMGFALAEQAQKLGANVTLVTGPAFLDTPFGVVRQDVITAEEMRAAVFENLDGIDIFLSVAAVSDFSCAKVLKGKIKKTKETTDLNLTLQRTPDILSQVATSAERPFCVGFAAEQQANGTAFAKEKLQAKSLDMIAMNYIDKPGEGFDEETNALQVLWQGGERLLEMAPKSEIAVQLWQLISERYDEKGSAKAPERCIKKETCECVE